MKSGEEFSGAGCLEVEWEMGLMQLHVQEMKSRCSNNLYQGSHYTCRLLRKTLCAHSGHMYTFRAYCNSESERGE
jgi:hypothetical protein